MSHQHMPLLSAYPAKQFQGIKNITRTDVIVRFSQIANILAVCFFVALLARIILSLFLVTGPLQSFATAFTQPLVIPFNNLIPTVTPEIQVGAMLAYSVYLPLFLVISWMIKSGSSPKDQATF